MKKGTSFKGLYPHLQPNKQIAKKNRSIQYTINKNNESYSSRKRNKQKQLLFKRYMVVSSDSDK